VAPDLADTEPSLIEGLNAMMDDFGAAGVLNTLLQLIDQIPKDDDTPLRDPFNEPLPDFGDLNDGQFTTWLGTDAVRWARAFDAVVADRLHSLDRLGTFLGWFANALEIGRGQGQRELGAAISLLRTQESLGINLLGNLDEAEIKLMAKSEGPEYVAMPVITRVPEKYVLLDTGKHMAWKWKVEAGNWFREPWPGEEQDWESGPEAEDPEAEASEEVEDPEVTAQFAFADVESVQELIGQFGGAVSMCWEPQPTGVFDSTMASRFMDGALARLRELELEGSHE